MTPKRIIGVAIRNDLVFEWAPPPNRHHNLLHASPTGDYEQGFVDEDMVFLTRLQAMDRAVETGQFNRDPNPNQYQGPKLYSEDLW
jgi:hypothetical protein